MAMSEKCFLDAIQKHLELSKCTVWREVIPDSCKNWRNPYQVDMILYRDDIGYIGVEGKKIRTLGQGAVISKAVTQIEEKYRDKTYFNGIKINRWCVAVPINDAGFLKKNELRTIKIFIQHFLWNHFKISILEYSPIREMVTIDAFTKRSLEIKQGAYE